MPHVPDDLPKDLFTPGSHLHVSGYTLLNSGSRNAVLAAMSHAHHAGMTISVDGASSAPLACVGAEPFLQCGPAYAGLPPARSWSVPGRCSSLRLTAASG
jgi:hypothetical protein